MICDFDRCNPDFRCTSTLWLRSSISSSRASTTQPKNGVFMRILAISAALLAVSACTTVTNQSTGTLSVDGKSYQTITREFQSGRGDHTKSYATTTVSVGAMRVTCIPDEPEDCAKAVRRAELGAGRQSIDGPVNANIFTLPYGL